MRPVFGILFCATMTFLVSGLTEIAKADVVTYEKCEVNTGKTLADVETVFREWRQVSENAGFGDYKIRLLVPHADSDTRTGIFWIEGSAPSLERHAIGWSWWYSAPEANAVAEAMEKVFTCESRSIFRTAASM